MKSVPRKDNESSKLLPFGILNKKNPQPQFSLMKPEGSNNDRFNEDVGQLLPKRSSARSLMPLTPSVGTYQNPVNNPLKAPDFASAYRKETSGGLTKGRNRTPDPNEILVRMGYQTQHHGTIASSNTNHHHSLNSNNNVNNNSTTTRNQMSMSMSMSLLSSQREKNFQQQGQNKLKLRGGELSAAQNHHQSVMKGNLMNSSQLSSSGSGFDASTGLNLEGEVQKIVQRFHSRCQGNQRIRTELAKHAQISEDVRKKVEHLDMLHSLVEVDFTDVLMLLANNSSNTSSNSAGTTADGLVVNVQSAGSAGGQITSGGSQHAMSAVSGLIDKYVQLSAYVMNLARAMQGGVIRANAEVIRWRDITEKAEQKMENVVMQKDVLQETLREKNAMLKKFIEMGEGSTNAGEMRSKKEKRENYITMENTKLAAENHQLAEKLKVLETGVDITNLRESLLNLQHSSEAKITKLLAEIETKDREIQRRKALIQSLSASLSKMELEVRSLRAKVDDQETQLKELSEKNADNAAKYVQFRERAFMQREDYNGLIQKTADQVVMLNSLREKSKALKLKLDRFIIGRSKEVEVPNDGSFPNDLNMLQVTCGEFQKDKSYFKHALTFVQQKIEAQAQQQAANGSTQQGGTFTFDPNEHFQHKYASILTNLIDRPESQILKESEQIQLAAMQISKPNFYIFIEQAAKNYELDMQNMKSRKISLGFIGNMRAILDSKYNEILLFEASPKQISKFVDFVYAWLGKFTIDNLERQVRLLSESEKNIADDTRVIFLLDLVNPKLNGVWEIVTFKEFLSEKSAIDEVFFYLHCRNLLLRGPSTQRHESTFDVYQFVTIEQAESVVDVIMCKYDPVNIMLIKKQMREKIKLRGDKQKNSQQQQQLQQQSVGTTTGSAQVAGGNASGQNQSNLSSSLLIESGFVLRILLEFYRIERKNRYKLMREAFLASSSIGAGGKFCINFLSFKKIVSTNFTDATEQEIAELYRESYSLGSGSVTVDMFQTVANDSGFFLRYMQLNSFVKTPVLDEAGNLAEVDSNGLYAYFFNMLDSAKSIQDVLIQQAIRLGVDRVYNEVEDINYQINHKFQQDVGELRGKPFVLTVQRILTVWEQLKAFKLFSVNLTSGGGSSSSDASKAIVNDLQSLSKVITQLNEFEHGRRIYAIERSTKLRKLQKMCRQKISKFYSFVSSLLSAKLKASVKQAQHGAHPQLKSSEADTGTQQHVQAGSGGNNKKNQSNNSQQQASKQRIS